MQLTFNPEKTRQHRSAVRNPFLKWGATLLVSLSIASQFDTPKIAHAQKAQLVSGTYHCDTVKRGVTVPYNLDVSLSVGPGYPPKNITVKSVDPDFNGKTFKFTSYDPQGAGTVVYDTIPKSAFSLLYLKENGLVNLSYFYMSGTSRSVKGAVCQIASSNPPAPGLRKGVFIRPCPNQFYASSSFTSKNAPPMIFTGGTISSACNDMAAAGVTDMFIAFKADDQSSAPECGQNGDLLYDSQQYTGKDANGNDYETKSFVTARSNGFDPILSIINACKSVYATLNKSVTFHAWVPVFNDVHAAAIKGMLAQQILQPDYRSGMFADPTNSDVVNYELSVISEIVNLYPNIGGINLDYIRYAGPNEDTKTAGNLTGKPADFTWDVKPDAVKGFASSVKSGQPGKLISADIFANPLSRVQIGQTNVPDVVDMLVPMIYSYFHMGGSDQVYLGVAANRINYLDKTMMPVLRGWNIPDPQSQGLIADLTADIAAVKNAGANGYAIFTYESLRRYSSSNLTGLSKKIGY